MNIASRRQRAADVLRPFNVSVLIAAGSPVGIPGGQDQQYPFIAHPQYRWLTDSGRPGGALVFDPQEGWLDFRVPVSKDEQIWEGAEAAELPEGVRNASGLAAWMNARGTVARLEGASEMERGVTDALLHLRRAKDPAEVALIERAVKATARGFAGLPSWIAPGASEREVAVRLEAEMFLAGADRMGYGTIVGTGVHSAVLHWPPTATRMQDGELVLVDAGGEVEGYTADVTRVYPVSGRWSGAQSELHQILLTAQIQAVAECREGAEWGELHTRTAHRLADGLRSLGLLTVSADEAVDSEAIALFFPHGLGHMLGMGVRDASGAEPGREPGRRFAGARVRMDLPLREGYLVTVEPGLYFIPPLLDDPELRSRHAGRVAWEKLEPWRALGGMRIEDNVLVTAGDPRNLTAMIPK